MLTFYFENGGVCTMRASGTEPKLKYYVECFSTQDPKSARALCDEMTTTIIASSCSPRSMA